MQNYFPKGEINSWLNSNEGPGWDTTLYCTAQKSLYSMNSSVEESQFSLYQTQPSFKKNEKRTCIDIIHKSDF